MDRITTMTRLSYASGHEEIRDLFITVELTDDLYLKEEERIIDALMSEFYKKYNDEIKKIYEKQKG